MVTLKTIVNDTTPMVIGITEVNPKNGTPMKQNRLKIDGYTLFAKCADGRGVCLYVKSELRTTVCNVDKSNHFEESVWVELQLRDSTKLLLGCLYRSPNSSTSNNDDLCRLIVKTRDTRWSHVLLMGDFNYGKLTWIGDGYFGIHNMTTRRKATHMAFLTATGEASLVQHVTQPTRECLGPQTPHILDLVFSRARDRVTEVDVRAHGLGESDHFLITFKFIAQRRATDRNGSAFTCLYTNADTLSNKMDKLKDLVEDTTPMVIGITEVNPKNGTPMEQNWLKIDGYTLFAKCADGRGVCLYVKSELRTTVCNVDKSNHFEESVWAEIQLRDGTKLLLGCLYRSPNSSTSNNDALCSLIAKTNSSRWSHVLIMGDFNYGKLTWTGDGYLGTHNMTTRRKAPHMAFLAATGEASLVQHVTRPTRKCLGPQTPHILDLVFSRARDRVTEPDVRAHGLDKSDHFLITFTFNATLKKKDAKSGKGAATQRRPGNPGTLTSPRRVPIASASATAMPAGSVTSRQKDPKGGKGAATQRRPGNPGTLTSPRRVPIASASATAMPAGSVTSSKKDAKGGKGAATQRRPGNPGTLASPRRVPIASASATAMPAGSVTSSKKDAKGGKGAATRRRPGNPGTVTSPRDAEC